MGSDLVHYMQQGVAVPDLLMGVCQAVVENYLIRVVQRRTIGRRVVLQGGLAMNRAVVQAFAARLKEVEVEVHPHPGLSGAIGMTLLTLERWKQASAAGNTLTSTNKGLNFSIEHRLSSFECTVCENRCEVGVFSFDQGRFHFGDLCGRYSEAISGFAPGRDLTPNLTGLVNQQDDLKTPHATIGIPSALLFKEYFPFWQGFFRRLSIQTVISGPSNNDKLTNALTRLPAETCLPVKLLFGHVAHQQKDALHSIFIPSTSRLLDGVSCPYVQHGAAMIKCNFEGIKIITLPLMPGLSAREKQQLAEKTAIAFALDKSDVLRAYDAADEEFALFCQQIRCEDATQPRRERPLAVLLGKPYNTGDPFINMALAAKLAKAGFDVITGEQLYVPPTFTLPDLYNTLTWAFSRQMLKNAVFMNGLRDVYPVVVGNFGCGPDSFTFPLLQEVFQDRPSLFFGV